MADKMMRLAGRGDDGTAKAIRTDGQGTQHVRVESVLKRVDVDMSGISAGESKTITLPVPEGKYFDIIGITGRIRTGGGGDLTMSITSGGVGLYQNMMELKGPEIYLQLDGFGLYNNSVIVKPNKFYPDEVVELQKYIKEVGYAGQTIDKSHVSIRLKNESDTETASDSILNFICIERG